MKQKFSIGQQVEGGDIPEDYDTGLVVEVNGDQITVAWDSSNQTTTQRADAIRPRSTDEYRGADHD